MFHVGHPCPFLLPLPVASCYCTEAVVGYQKKFALCQSNKLVHHLGTTEHRSLADNVSIGHCAVIQLYLVIIIVVIFNKRSHRLVELLAAAVRTFSIKLDTSPDNCNLNSEMTTATPNDLHVKLHAISNIWACYSCRRIQRLQRGAMGCGFFYVLDTIVSYDSP